MFITFSLILQILLFVIGNQLTRNIQRLMLSNCISIRCPQATAVVLNASRVPPLSSGAPMWKGAAPATREASGAAPPHTATPLGSTTPKCRNSGQHIRHTSVPSQSGYARQCYTCFGTNPNLCVGLVSTCAASDDVCMSIYTSRTMKSVVSSVEFVRMCGKSTFCKQGQTITSSGYIMRQSTTCCTSDNCTPPTPQLPPEPESKENGVSCRTCFSDSYYCETKDKMKCRGSENKCVRYSARTDKDSKMTQYAMRGCASENVCLVGSSSLSFGGSTVKTDVACTDAGIRPEHGLLLPLFAGLVLLKLFC